MKLWWVVYKVNPEMDNHRYDAYMERHDNDRVVHVYQEENEGYQSLSFIISDGAGLTELVIPDVELMEEEPHPSKKRLRKSKRLTEKQERSEQLNARVAEADSDADDF
jgi:ketosteroid isomerase-like protein